MNNTVPRPFAFGESSAIEARFALRVAACLTDVASELPQDVAERLRFAREKALERAHAMNLARADAILPSGPHLSLIRSEGAQRWWVPLGSMLPLFALVAGLVLIQRWHNDSQIAAAAEIDASLLADDLPPSAYSDPGFLEFLKTPRD